MSKPTYKELKEKVSSLENQFQKIKKQQQMESTVQLAGGVAHDFNNLLAVIMGNIDKMFLSGSCWQLSRLFSVIALICMATMINACGNPFGYEDMNDEFWSNHSEMRKDAEQRMEDAKAKLKTLDDVQELQKLFNYVPEPMDWIPTIEVLFARNLTDDCDGATVLGKWSLAQIGIKSRVVELYGNQIHAVCISEDNTIMITNNEVVRIPQDHWKEAVLTYFNPPYKSLKVVN